MRGSVVKRGKTWSIVYDDKSIDNKRNQKWESGFPTKKKAESTLRERINEIENSFANKQESCQLGIYLDYWLESYAKNRLAQNTINGYKVNINKHIKPYIGKFSLNKLQPVDIDNLYSKLRENKLSGTSIRYVHNTLHKALNTAVKKRTMSYNVLDHVDAPTKDNYKATVLTSEQIVSLLNVCKQYHDKRTSIAVVLGLLLGLRRGEVLGLRWSDFDLDNKIVLIQRTATFYKGAKCVFSDVKTDNSKRSLLLADIVVDYLNDFKTWQESIYGAECDYLFYTQGENILSASALNHQFKRMLDEYNLPSIRFHDLRHTNATLMLRSNIPAKIVSSMLGHSSIGITLDTYSHVLIDMQQPVVDVIQGLLKT